MSETILYNKTILVLSNFGVLVFLLMLMLDHYRGGYNMQSWSTLFHFFCVMWLVFRGLFWLCTMVSDAEWSAMQFHSLYWLPNAFEFAAFSLLPMFFAQLIYANEWKKYWKVIKPIYIVFICTIFALQILWAIMAGLNTKCLQGGMSGMHPVATNHNLYRAESLSDGVQIVDSAYHPTSKHVNIRGAQGSASLHLQRLYEQESSGMFRALWKDAATKLSAEEAAAAEEEEEESQRSSTYNSNKYRKHSRKGEIGENNHDADDHGDDEKNEHHHHHRQDSRRPDAADVYYEDCYGTDFSSAASRLLASILFMALAVTQATYGYKILNLPLQQYSQHFTAPLILMNTVNAVLTICFTTRGLYLFGSLLGLDMLPAIPLQYDQDIALSVLFCFELWDYIPILLLLLSVTSRPIGSGSLTLHGYSSIEDTDSYHYYSRSSGKDGSFDSVSGHGGTSGGGAAVGGSGGGQKDGWRSFFTFTNRGDSNNRSRSDDDDHGGNSGRTSRSGSMTVGGRVSRSGTFDRPRGMGGAARALDQLEIELQSDMHSHSMTPGGNLAPAPMGSLERFAAPSSLEPPKSWLTADRMAFEMTAQHMQQPGGVSPAGTGSSYQNPGGMDPNLYSHLGTSPTGPGSSRLSSSASKRMAQGPPTGLPGAFDLSSHTGTSILEGDTGSDSASSATGSFTPSSSLVRSELLNRGGAPVTTADALEIAQTDRVNILHDRQNRRKRGGSDLGVPAGLSGPDVPVAGGAAAVQAPSVTIDGVSIPPRSSRPKWDGRDRDAEKEEEKHKEKKEAL